jgi:heme exporter protein B
MTALLIGTPTLSLIGAVGAALTLGARRRGILMPLVVLPLYIPILIFGVGAIDTASMGFDAGGLFAVLGGFLLIAAALCPWAAAAALKIASE